MRELTEEELGFVAGGFGEERPQEIIVPGRKPINRVEGVMHQTQVDALLEEMRTGPYVDAQGKFWLSRDHCVQATREDNEKLVLGGILSGAAGGSTTGPVGAAVGAVAGGLAGAVLMTQPRNACPQS